MKYYKKEIARRVSTFLKGLFNSLFKAMLKYNIVYNNT